MAMAMAMANVVVPLEVHCRSRAHHRISLCCNVDIHDLKLIEEFGSTNLIEVPDRLGWETILGMIEGWTIVGCTGESGGVG